MVHTTSEAKNQPTIDDLLGGRIDLPAIRKRLSDPHIADSVFGEVMEQAKKGDKLGQHTLPYGYSEGREITFREDDEVYITLMYLVGRFSDAIGIGLPPEDTDGKPKFIYLRRDFFRLKKDYPWVEFRVPRLAHFDEIGEDITSKPQNNPSPYQQ